MSTLPFYGKGHRHPNYQWSHDTLVMKTYKTKYMQVHYVTLQLLLPKLDEGQTLGSLY